MSSSRRDFLKQMGCASAGVALGAAARAGEAEAERPTNVLFIMTDQQWGGCVGYAGHPYVQTPNLDALARDGVVFDNAYCTYPVCTASRCSILTGLWPHTHGCNLNVGSPEKDPGKGLPPDTVMTESILAEHGYITRHRGKWHAGGQARHSCYQTPDGFHHMSEYWRYASANMPKELFKSGAGQALCYNFPLYMTPEVEAVHKEFHEQGWVPGQDITLIGKTSIPSELMEDSWITDECLGLLDTYGQNPFMITCSVHPPHAYWIAPEGYYDLYNPDDIKLPANQTRPDYYKRSLGVRLFDHLGAKGRQEYLRCYYAQVTHVDMNVGRLVKKLKDIGQYENTLIVFTSDHGDMNGAHQMLMKSVTPAQYEETAKVPLLMSCPRLLPKGKRVKTMNTGVDLMPTILDYLGMDIPGHIHGKSLRTCIEGKEDLDRAAFTEGTHPTAQHVARRIRTQEWRYYFSYQNWSTKGERFEQNIPLELFHLAEDPGEEHNLAADPKYRDVMRRLDTQLRDHLAATKDPWLADLPTLEQTLA